MCPARHLSGSRVPRRGAAMKLNAVSFILGTALSDTTVPTAAP
jgi:hypothetical protein